MNYNKKGQAALEFLMTYGWAILVVLAAIGALAYFGVLDPGAYLPSKCIATPGLSCVEKPQVLASSIAQSVNIDAGYTITPAYAVVGTNINATPVVKVCAKPAAGVAFNAITCGAVSPLVQGTGYILVVQPGTNFIKGQTVKEEVTVTSTNPNSGLVDSWVVSLSGRI